MLIRTTQVAQMMQYTEETFLRRVMEFIVEDGQAEADDLSLRIRCEELIRKARNFGFATEFEVATFTSCGFSYGFEFYADANLPFHQLLMNPNTDAATKADEMVEILEGSIAASEENERA